MNKNLMYVIATVLALVIVMLLAKGGNQEQVSDSSLPSNGLVESTEPAASADQPSPADASAPSPASPDDVPAGAEVTGDAPAAPEQQEEGTDQPEIKDVPPAEGQ